MPRKTRTRSRILKGRNRKSIPLQLRAKSSNTLPIEERIREILIMLDAKPSNSNIEKVITAITQNTIQLENY